jgi:SAM-dependent methyltransferase
MDPAEFQSMIAVDDHHWWYRGRRRIVISQIAQLDLPANAQLLDAGCGSGRTLDELSHFGVVAGCDLNPLAIEAAKSRGHSDVRLGRLEELPFEDHSFDLVTCLDVVEHVSDDLRAFTELRRVTRPGGHLLVTVPAYQWLWSQHDVANHHMRRYRRSTLLPVAEAAGWQPVRDTYFYSWLLPAAAIVRETKRVIQRVGTNSKAPNSELDSTPSALDAALVKMSATENKWLKRGRRLPAGLSLLALFANPETGE